MGAKRDYEIMWFIEGWCGFYCGGASTRREAIDAHTGSLGQTWAYCRKKGDRSVKCEVRKVRS